MVNKVKDYLDSSKTIKKRGKQFETIPRAFGNASKNIRKTKPKNIIGKSFKWTGVALFLALQALAKTLKIGLVDNWTLRTLEIELSKIKADKKKFNAFLKKHPGLYAYIVYLITMAITVTGGIYIAGHEKDNDEDKIEKSIKQTIDDFVLNPIADDKDWSKQLEAIHPYVLAHVISSEGYIKSAYYDNGSKGTITFGSGFTIADKRHKDFARKVLGRPVGNGSSITVAENRMLVSAWLYEEVYPKIKKNFDVPLDARLFEILAVAAYNRGESTYDNKNNSGWTVRTAVNSKKSKEEIANAFVYSFAGIKGTRWGGLPNKYAVAALYYLGQVSNETLLNAISEAPYTIEPHIKKEPYNGRLLKYENDTKKSHASGIYKIDNIEELLLKTKHRITKGTEQQPVKEYLTSNQVEIIMKGQLFTAASFDMENYVSPVKHLVSQSEELNYQGETSFFEEDYITAVNKFEAALKADPKNYIAYSNLSIAYYKQGNYEKGLNVVQKLLSSSYAKEIPTEIKSYTYYNAALCREALGDSAEKLEDMLDHYKKSKSNVLLAQKFRKIEYDTFMVRIGNKITEIETAIKSKKPKTSKKISFNSAGNKIEKKSKIFNTNAMYARKLLNDKRTIG